MILLMPTCDTHTRAAEISAQLLAKHWPNHPPLHVAHHAKRPDVLNATFHAMGEQAEVSWTEGLARAVREAASDTFLLLLDDYALSQRPDTAFIHRAESMMGSAVMFQLWPHSFGEPVAPGIERRMRPAMLLQPAIWRSEFFLSIAEAVGPVNPWIFEVEATRANLARPGGSIYGVPND